jgi:hypothetical protein
MWMSQHSFLMKKRFRQIIDVKFKRRCRFYFEFCRFRIENDHQCYVKYENFLYFLVNSNRVRKIFRRFSNSLFWTMLITFIRKLIFLDVNTFNKAFSVFKNSFDKFDKLEQRKLFFRKEKLFSLFNNLIFRKNEIIF